MMNPATNPQSPSARSGRLRTIGFVVLLVLIASACSAEEEQLASDPDFVAILDVETPAPASEPAVVAEPAEPADPEPAGPDSTEPEPVKQAPVVLGRDQTALVWSMFGGCSDFEVPSCPTWTVRRDGHVTMQLPAQLGTDEVSGTGMVQAAVLDEWVTIAATTDFDELASLVGDGPCEAATDGVDHRAMIPWLDAELDECGMAFDRDQPFFAALWSVAEQAMDSAIE